MNKEKHYKLKSGTILNKDDIAAIVPDTRLCPSFASDSYFVYFNYGGCIGISKEDYEELKEELEQNEISKNNLEK
jgi:hypothetical protein